MHPAAHRRDLQPAGIEKGTGDPDRSFCALLIHINERIEECPPHPNLKMQMVSGRVPGRADLRDFLPLFHRLPNRHIQLTVVPIEGLAAIRMPDDDTPSILAVPARKLDGAARRCIDRRSIRRGEVYPIVTVVVLKIR